MNIFRKAIKNLHPAAPLRAAAAAVFVSLAIPLSAQLKAAPEPLITDPTKVQVLGLNSDNINLPAYNAPGASINLNTPFQVNLNDNEVVELSPTRGLVLYFARYADDKAPTVVEVAGRVKGTNTYQPLGYAYLQFRGGGRTHEFSNRVYSPNLAEYDSFEFKILEVSSGENAEFYKFNIFAIDDDQAYPGGRLDPLHSITDYYTGYKDYKYISNKGILSHRNHYGDNATYYCQGGGVEEMSTPWGENHTFVYDGEVYDLPTFDKQGDSQMPHITEQTIYAMPGDMITLIPFYDLPNVGNYREKFSHWYGYVPKNENGELQNQDYSFEHVKDNDGNNLLDFLIDPAAVIKTDGCGYFGGSAFPRRSDHFTTIDDKEYFVIANYIDLCDFAEYVYQSKDREYTNAILVADIECNGAAWPISIGASNPSLTGNPNVEYRGEFNGNGHAIKNLNINRGNNEYHTGLFGMVHSGCNIHDLQLLNVNVESGGRAAGLIGMAWENVTVENVLVTGNVKITATGNLGGNNVSYAAGILAYHNSGNLNFKNVGFVGTISGGYGTEGANAALVARTTGGTLSNCYADATIGNLTEGASMYAPAGRLTVSNSYMNVRSGDVYSLLEANVYQQGFSNVYNADADAFHTEIHNSGKHIVRVYGIPDSWADPHIHYWNGAGYTTTWPGIKFSTKGEGYYEFEVENNDADRIMINDGKEDGEQANKSNGEGAEIRFNNSTGNFNITFTGNNNGNLTVTSVPGEIYVLDNFENKNYILLLSNSKNEMRLIQTPDREEGEYLVYSIPDDIEATGLKYSVITSDATDNLLAKCIANPLPGKVNDRRIYVKRNVPGWDHLYTYLWSEVHGFTQWGRANTAITVKFDDEEYFYYDFPSNMGGYWGLNFRDNDAKDGNGNELPFNQYQDAIVRFDGDMMVALTEVPTNQEQPYTGKIKGGYFHPLFFEYVEGEAAPEITVNGTTYKAMTVTVGANKYYCINLAPIHDSGNGFMFPDGNSGTLQNPIQINSSEIVSYGSVLKSQGADMPAQFYDTLLVNGDTYVYLDNRDKDFNEAISEKLEGDWSIVNETVTPPMTTLTDLELDESLLHGPIASHELRWYGTVGTFYQPRKGKYAPDSKENLSLDLKDGAEAFHIAADFAHEFNPTAEFNLDNEEKTIHEPILSFRYIWHVKDGKKFADDYTSTVKGNENYLKKNNRTVSARTNQDFQVRLNTTVPANDLPYTSTNFYYKKGDNSYARAPRVGLEVYALDDNNQPTGDEIEGMFNFDAILVSQGIRYYQDIENGIGSADKEAKNTAYFGGDGNMSVYRVIYCPYTRNQQPGKYRVRLVAMEADGKTPIKVMGTDTPLYIDEYIINFVGDEEASVINEKDLIQYTADSKPEGSKTNYYYHRAEYLEQDEVAGAPAVVVDFDQYRAFENDPYDPTLYFRTKDTQDLSTHRTYKWPTLWESSSYSFGYGGYYNYDYNEYILANHSSQVAYHASADNHKNPYDNTETGLYDRLYYDTYDTASKTGDRGYFYYVNAATDPGVIAKLQIHALCPGSTVAVSAWVAEMSDRYATANVAFNFMAVDAQGDTEPVHTFVTGFIDNQQFGSADARKNADQITVNHGDWMHVYYSFIPDLEEENIQMKVIDHYELWIENNCVSSDGADYAVDDIRAYIISPQITARQLQPVCDPEQKTIGIRISSRYDKLLSSNGLKEASNSESAEKIKLNFAVLDKKTYDEGLAEYLKMEFADNAAQNAALCEVVNKAKISMMADLASEERKDYIGIDFSSYYDDMEEYDDNAHELNKALRYTSASGTRYFRTDLLPFDENLLPGKEYYIVLYPEYEGVNPIEDQGLSAFAITGDACDKYAVMTLQGSGVIKIDGIAYNDGEPIDVCEGQSPVVQVDLKMLHDDKEIDMPAYNDYDNAPAHYYDWFVGPVDEFMATPENGGSSYYDLLYLFRNGETPDGASTPSGKGNIDADQLPDPVEGEEDRYAPLRQLIKEGRLVLHASSFVFPPLKNTDEADNIHVLTAMPIIPGPDDEEGYKVCSQPNEIRLRVQNNSPLMFDGFTGIDYPEADVPVRVGLSQLRSVRELGALTIEDRTGNRLGLIPNVTIPENLRKLEIPLRGLLSYKGEDVAAEMTMAGNRNEAADPYVYLVETDDPAYISLDKHPMNEMPIRNSLLPIGMVDNLSAKTTEDGKNNVTILFDKEMQFAEGYYYRVRFTFDEVIPTEVEGYCEGHVVFTIKVVPEYQKWTGADSRNWNNDANWSRVTADDILLPAGDAKTDDFTVVQKRSRIPLIVDADGSVTPKPEKLLPSNRRSYAPLDFTKVLVSKMANDTTTGYPYMFAATEKNIMTLHDEMSWNNRALPDGIPTMEPTENIQYDMVSLDLKDGALAMRPWYANTCEQIHFNHGAEMAHQESFIFEKNYQKAWVDMEMTSDRWYTLASPLQGVVAGDMYTKTTGGKQDNELYTDITFNNDDYGRYEPAVYQRGWNKAEAATYLLGDNSHDSKSAAVQLNWSRVYNDVDEDYAPGLGFSIRTATDGITAPDKDDDGNVTVRFRLPKADDSYSYFDKNDNTEGADDTAVGRTGNRHALTAFGTDGKLTVNLTVGTDGTYFLAGNPFMARMKMAEFLAGNAAVIESAYWIMTDERQEATLWDEKSGTFISTDKTEATDGTIAPMQGFFVKAKEKGSTLPLTFTPAMIDDGEIDNSVILRAPRAERRQLLTISAIDAEGETASRALIKLDAEASATFEPSEDVTLLIDRTLEEHPSVYTVASGQALAINSLDAIVETEVGLLANEESAHTLLFEGVDESEELRLLDTVTGEISDLYDGMEIEVKGAAAGRYYIVRPSDMMEEVTMAILLKERTVSVVAETAGITARVYTPDGLCSGEWSTADSLLHFDLEPGIFIVEAMADGRRMMRKFIVR